MLRLCGSVCSLWRPFVAHVLEPVGAAVLSLQPRFAVVELAFGAAAALVRVGAVEEWDVLVPDITEPGHRGQYWPDVAR